MTTTTYHNIMDVLDDEIPYPDWMEADIYGDADEESYNEMLMDGGDL